MKRFVLVWSIILILSSIGAAQSGRKIVPTQTPTPIRDSEPNPDYSESRPNKRSPKTISPNLPSNSDAQQTDKIADEPEIKIETNLITIPVSVFDRNGLYIPNLIQENFKIFEDNAEQEIAYFGTTEKPFTVLILLDTSPSTVFKIEEIQQAAIAFIDQLKPQDKVMVIEFDENIHVLTEPTGDRQKLYKAIEKADIGGGTSIYDAVDFAFRKRLDRIEGRKAIILFTDGVDTTSNDANFNSTLQYAEEADALIFPIYYNTYSETQNLIDLSRGTSIEEYRTGKKYLVELAELTGGRVFQSGSTAFGLNRAFAGIAEELRRQYNIGYYPKEIGKPGQRRLLRVRVNRPNLIVQARGSYIFAEK